MNGIVLEYYYNNNNNNNVLIQSQITDWFIKPNFSTTFAMLHRIGLHRIFFTKTLFDLMDYTWYNM